MRVRRRQVRLSVTELLPLTAFVNEARQAQARASHATGERKKATDSRRNNFLSKHIQRLDLDLTLSLSLVHLTHTISHCTMKLDTRALRYLTSDDWRVLAAVCPQHQHLDGSQVLFD
jgi:hypothetical protein